jgi:hypothetical protein
MGTVQRARILLAFAMMTVGCPSSGTAPTVTTAEASAPPPAASSVAPAASAEPTTMSGAITITDPSQREAAVGKAVIVIGKQTRNKMPTVNGVDVDGAYELSDKKVVARGILEKHVEDPDPPGAPHAARRAPGTFYGVVDPATKRLATTRPAD